MTSKNGPSKTITLKIAGKMASLSEAAGEFKAPAISEQTLAPTVSFASWDLMHKVLSPKKLALIKALRGREPISIRELARRVGRDFKGVHTDVSVLVNAGIIDREDNKISCRYDNIHVEFDIGVSA